jgi:hypothetical protein
VNDIGYGGIRNTDVAAPRRSELHDRLDSLHAEIDSLKAATHDLFERLGSVTRQEPAAAKAMVGENVNPGMSAVAGRLREATANLADLRMAIADRIGLLDL